jgi:2-keto-4-pentenoate hydratase/2-oxohepta-3-ene-1,7-dioic acid hydratase in catechol pathway
MRLVRARHGERVVLARVEGEAGVVVAVERPDPGADVLRDAVLAATDLRGDGEPVVLSELEPLAPVAWPSKIVCVGLNYPLHAQEADEKPPARPLLFCKTPNALCGPDDVVSWPGAASAQVDYEAELVAIVGRPTQGVSPAEAPAAIFGFTCGNDISARDAQFGDGQWYRGKSFDGFAPIGPAVVTSDELDASDLRVRCRMNGRTMQDASTAEMLFDLPTIVSYVSQAITLLPGDVLYTGTPDGVGVTRQPPVLLGDGDAVEVEIEGIGTLRNTMSVRV